MRVAIVKPPQQGSIGRGIGFLNERLLSELSKIKGLALSIRNFHFWQSSYPNCDLVHFPYFDEYFFTLPPLLATKYVVTIPDATKLVFPQYFPVGLRGRLAWPIQGRLAARAGAVITISESAKLDISECFKMHKEKIFVTHLAADQDFRPIKDTSILRCIRAKYHLPEKFVLYVGGVNWNKNLSALIKSCQKINMNLVLVGKEFTNERVDLNHAELQSFKEILSLVKDNPEVWRLGFVPTPDLVAIYNLAAVYVQPSVYEGFGLPILEAMSCGTPVICGENSSLPEIAGTAATYADVTSVVDLADKIFHVRRTGKEISQAAQFSWTKTAKETYEIYKKVLVF